MNTVVLTICIKYIHLTFVNVDLLTESNTNLKRAISTLF